ncbi:pyrBI operon leader peptide, partial [Salmonella enterica]|nr:pyrBI operon leader peptide [Salmonella enterica]EJN8458747.1 pyrBI operon leader peptide [Salmonella enterica]
MVQCVRHSVLPRL